MDQASKVPTVSLKAVNGKPVLMKLGRVRPVHTYRTEREFVTVLPDGRRKSAPRLGAFYDSANDKAPPPDKIDWSAKAMKSILRVYLNDQYGDCVIAGKYHHVGVWTGNDTSEPVLATDAEVLNSYHRICGPGDNGCVITDVLDYFKSKGLPFNGTNHKIDGYVSVDWTNKQLVKVAIDLFGGLTLGINLPGDWTCTNCTWDVSRQGIVGGHDICAVGYDERGVQCATWGGIVTITWAAFMSKKWLEECYALLAPDWYNEDKLAPNGIDLAALQAALASIEGGNVPPIPDPTPPVPPTPPTPPVPPPLPPPPPVPPTFAVSIPQQPVYVFGMPIGQLHAFSVQGQITQSMRGANRTIHLPPWLLPILKQICQGMGPVIPPPFNIIVALLCNQIPTLEAKAMRGEALTVTIPPWAEVLLTQLVNFICATFSSYSPMLAAICSFKATPKKSPCGCH